MKISKFVHPARVYKIAIGVSCAMIYSVSCYKYLTYPRNVIHATGLREKFAFIPWQIYEEPERSEEHTVAELRCSVYVHNSI